MRKYNLPDIHTKAEAVILANGEFPTHSVPLSILHNTEFLVCCDGAINNIGNCNITPSAIVGDCDSLNNENKLKYAHIITKNPDQETNDLTKSINYCKSKGFDKLLILGATGKREDHTLANISLLVEYMDFIEVEMITDLGIFTPIKDVSLFQSYLKQQVSLFAMEKCSITTQNLKYGVKNSVFTNLWQGTLNESVSHEFIIETSGKIIVYRAF